EVERLLQSLDVVGVDEEADLEWVELECDEAIVAVAGQGGKERTQGQRTRAGQRVGAWTVSTPNDIAQMNVAEHRAHDLVAGHEVFTVGACMAGVEGHAAAPGLREVDQRLQVVEQVALGTLAVLDILEADAYLRPSQTARQPQQPSVAVCTRRLLVSEEGRVEHQNAGV